MSELFIELEENRVTVPCEKMRARIIQVETSEKVEDIEELFLKVIQKYPKCVQKILQQYFYGKYKNLQGSWRISQTLSDVGTNAGISEVHRPVLQQHAFNILEAKQ